MLLGLVFDDVQSCQVSAWLSVYMGGFRQLPRSLDDTVVEEQLGEFIYTEDDAIEVVHCWEYGCAGRV